MLIVPHGSHISASLVRRLPYAFDCRWEKARSNLPVTNNIQRIHHFEYNTADSPWLHSTYLRLHYKCLFILSEFAI